MDSIKRELNYHNVFIPPQKTIVNSRKECDTTIKFGPKIFDMPVYASNMKSVINEDTCIYFAKNNYFYSMHRFGIDVVEFAKKMLSQNIFISISIGINEDSYEVLKKLLELKIYPEYITIDVANAWSIKTEKIIKYVKDNFQEKTFLIVGNISSKNATIELDKWGADSIKVGQSGGLVCITKNKTGFHRPMVSTTLECVSATNKPIIADGGIREHGDIPKALCCGATMVMAGSLFCAYDESSGEIIEIDGKEYKEYYGSASQYNKKQYKNVEGKKILIPYRGSIDKLLIELKEDLQSSISYAGGKDLSVFRTLKDKLIMSY
jgi:GMP reductase